MKATQISARPGVGSPRSPTPALSPRINIAHSRVLWRERCPVVRRPLSPASALMPLQIAALACLAVAGCGQVSGGSDADAGATRKDSGHDAGPDTTAIYTDSGSTRDVGVSDTEPGRLVCAREASDGGWRCGDATVQRCMEGIVVGVACQLPPARVCFAYCGANGLGQEYFCDSGAGWHTSPTLIPCSQ